MIGGMRPLCEDMGQAAPRSERARTQVVCRVHAALCDLISGGVSKEIYAAHAARFGRRPSRAAPWPWPALELAAELVAGLRRADALLRETNKKLATAVRASGTSLT